MGGPPRPGSTSSRPRSTRAVRHGMIRPPELMNEKSCSKADAGFLGSFSTLVALAFLALDGDDLDVDAFLAGAIVTVTN